MLVEQVDISVDASPICQVDVVPFVQLERTVHQCRIFGEELHADASSSEGCIQAQIDALFFLGIEVLQEHLRLSIADGSIQIDFEGFLFGLGRTDDSGKEVQPVRSMFQVETEGIDGQAIGHYIIKVGFAIDSFIGRSVKIHQELVERDALRHAQVVSYRIVLARCGPQANTRKEGFQLFLIDGLRCPLLTGTSGKGIHLLEDIFHIALSFEMHVQVSGTHVSPGRIHRSREAHKEVLGLESAFRGTDIGMGHRSIDHVFLLHIAHERHIKLMRGGERHFHELHHLPIELGHLHGEVCRNIVGLQFGIEAGIYFHSGVPRLEGSIELMVFERCHQVISRQPVIGIMHLVHGSLYVEIGFGSKEIQSFAIGMKVHRHIEKRVLREELMHIEFVHHEVGQIGILAHVVLGIESGCPTHLESFCKGKGIVMYGQLRAVHQGLGSGFGLLQKEIGSHLRACHGKYTFQLGSSTDGKLSIGQRTQEAHVKGFGRKIDFPTPTGTVGEMQQITLRLHLESLGKLCR